MFHSPLQSRHSPKAHSKPSGIGATCMKNLTLVPSHGALRTSLASRRGQVLGLQPAHTGLEWVSVRWARRLRHLV